MENAEAIDYCQCSIQGDLITKTTPFTRNVEGKDFSFEMEMEY
ncbi:hypothetical protein [Candidatus Neptunichlamydia sp. REUL1]|nr:hypothetical protein [Candidatus Neptunochlamydia sp. REUL1]